MSGSGECLFLTLHKKLLLLKKQLESRKRKAPPSAKQQAAAPPTDEAQLSELQANKRLKLEGTGPFPREQKIRMAIAVLPIYYRISRKRV